MVRFTEDDIKGLEYVLIEVSLKKDSTNKMRGLFIGIQPMVESHTQLVSKDENFFWLYREDSLYMYNLSHYQVNVIEIGKPNQMSSYTAGGTDQANYIERLRSIQAVHAKLGKVLKSGLIDADEYSPPEKILKTLKADTTTDTGGNHTPHDYSPAGNYSGYRGAAYNRPAGNYYKKKEVTTSLIKRTTRYSVSKAIDKMKAKVEELRKGTYEAPKLKVLEDPKKEGEADKKSVDKDEDDDYSQYGVGFFTAN